MTFEDLGLAGPLLDAVEDVGYEIPTPVQEQSIPIILDGIDLLGCAQTGTGKTAAFALPILDDLDGRSGNGPLALVLTPTRELAFQVTKNFETYGRYLPDISVVAIVGGDNMNKQIQKLKAGARIVVATPGRLLDHLQRGTVRFPDLRTLVLDEADRMLDMGFIHDVKRIIRQVAKNRQTLLFSATLTPDIENLARDLLYEPEHVGIALQTATADTVRQVLHPVDSGRRRSMLAWLLADESMEQVLVFTRTRRGADTLARVLENQRVSVTLIHGERRQSERNAALEAFKNGKVRVLVATDIASRGLHIDGISHVINYDIPLSPDDYVHRVGRTGRAGAEGSAITLVTAEDWDIVREIETAIGRSIPRETIPEFEPLHREPVRTGPKDWDGRTVKVVFNSFS